jgi:L-alanine-DL-glutamate epimerase-like enolase superfamily enzyme
MIGDTKLFWVEEPFAESLESCRLLRDWMKNSPFSKTLYAEGEYGPDFNLMKQLTDSKLIDVLLYDIISYGWSKWRSLLPSLKGTGITASPHAWGSGIKTNYIVHLCSAFGNTATIEGVTSFSDDVDLTAYKIRNGMITPPDLPGFGMKLLKKL